MRYEQICLASSDLLHMHPGLAGTSFNYHHSYYCYYDQVYGAFVLAGKCSHSAHDDHTAQLLYQRLHRS